MGTIGNIDSENHVAIYRKKKYISVIITIFFVIVTTITMYIAYSKKDPFSDIILPQNTFELGTVVDLAGKLQLNPAKIIDVSIIDRGNFDSNKCGDYPVKFCFKDKKGNYGEREFIFRIVDTTPPKITLNEKNIYLLVDEDFNPENYVTISDNNEIKSVNYYGNLCNSIVGEYEILITATDLSGNVSNPENVTVIVEERGESDIRNAKFGDSHEVVKRYELLADSDVLVENENIIMYHTVLNGENANLVYYFNDRDELYQVIYVFTDTHTDTAFYINSYYGMVDILTKKYGTPTDTDVIKNSMYPYCDDDAEALSIGQIKFNNVWKLDNMDIALVLGNDNFEISYLLGYVSNEYEASVNDSGF